MRMPSSKQWRTPVCCAALFVYSGLAGAADIFYNSSPVFINNDAVADPYPSPIVVSNVVGEVARVTLTLSNLTHEYPTDLEILLVAPSGQTCLVMGHVGGFKPVAGVSVTFDDTALASVPQFLNSIFSGVFRPTVSERPLGNTLLIAPAPAPPYDYDLAVMSGFNPNGTWKLFVIDSDDENGGVISGGWALSIETALRLQIKSALSEVEISWPLNVPEAYVLQSNPQVTPGQWTDVPQFPAASEGRKVVRIRAPDAPRFFRLYKN
jgi:large repetitive protein